VSRDASTYDEPHFVAKVDSDAETSDYDEPQFVCLAQTRCDQGGGIGEEHDPNPSAEQRDMFAI